MTYQLKVDMDRCQGHGICAVLAGDLVDLDQWGFPVITSDPLSEPAQLRRARWAVAACPARALQLESAPVTTSERKR
ncbi:MAG: ferredoxin [Candidatus Dormibacteria bacterium]